MKMRFLCDTVSLNSRGAGVRLVASSPTGIDPAEGTGHPTVNGAIWFDLSLKAAEQFKPGDHYLIEITPDKPGDRPLDDSEYSDAWMAKRIAEDRAYKERVEPISAAEADALADLDAELSKIGKEAEATNASHTKQTQPAVDRFGAELRERATEAKDAKPNPGPSAACATCRGARHLQHSDTGEIRVCPDCNADGYIDKSLRPGNRWS